MMYSKQILRAECGQAKGKAHFGICRARAAEKGRHSSRRKEAICRCCVVCRSEAKYDLSFCQQAKRAWCVDQTRTTTRNSARPFMPCIIPVLGSGNREPRP
jgi:hypothetical protein